MKVLSQIQSEHVIAIDIETVRVCDKFDTAPEGYKEAWSYKNKQEGVIPDYEKLEQMWEMNTALYAEFSKVCAVSIAFMHQGELYCKEFYGVDEKAVLEQLADSLDKIVMKGKEEGITYRLVGHSAKFFDYPFLSKRYIINEMDIPLMLDSTNLKPWETTNLCTNELWKVGGLGAGSSLQALCNVLNIPVSKTDLVGDEVGQSYFKDEHERISRYCSQDSVATFNIFRKFKKESIFAFEDVKYVNGMKGRVSKLTPLEELLHNKKLTPELKEQLLSRGELLEEELPIIREMLLANITPHKPTKAVIGTAEKQVDKFLKELNGK